MELTQALLELEEKISEIQDEIKTLRKYVTQLEEQNEILRKKLYKNQDEDSKENQNNLQALYEQDFHVCPMHFGKARTEDCIFCVSFLEKNKEDS